MTVMQGIYQQMSMTKLREMARQDSDLDTEEAARVYVQRLCDMELERRLDMRHNRPGWHACSPGFGDGTGSSSVASDAMLIAYEQGIPQSPWHDHARIALSRLTERRLAALMIKTAKGDYRTSGPLSAKYDDIAASIGSYAQELGWPPGVVALDWYANGRSIRKAALDAKAELILLAKCGVI